MELATELFYKFIAWHEQNFFLSGGNEKAYTLGQYFGLLITSSYLLVMVSNLVHSDKTHRSYIITSIVIASSHVFSTIGFLAIHDFIMALNDAEPNSVKLQFSWVAFDSFCIFFIVWLHIGTSTPVLRSSKIVMYLLLINSLCDVGAELLGRSEAMWVFIGENPYYENGRYRPHLALVAYSYVTIIISATVWYYLGGKFIYRRIRRKRI